MVRVRVSLAESTLGRPDTPPPLAQEEAEA